MAIDSALETQIQDALNRDPTFIRAGVKVTATGDGLELSGEVPSGRERLNAGRIAQSYARGKKVINHIVVKGHSTPAGPASPDNPPANLSGSARRP
jgi:osmotically-inducible protein OsmY